MKIKKNVNTQFYIICVLTLISLLISISLYYTNLVNLLEQNNCRTLNEVLQQEKNNFVQRLTSCESALQGYSQLLVYSVVDNETLCHALSTIKDSTDYESIVLSDTSGNAIDQLGNLINISDRDYFKSALQGYSSISEPITSKTKHKTALAIATPVKIGSVQCVLVATLETEYLNNTFLSSFDGYGYSYVVTANGDVVSHPPSKYSLLKTDNIFDILGQAVFTEDDSYETLRNNMMEGKGGHSKYEYSGEKRLMHYQNLPINDWTIFSITSPEGIMEVAQEMIINAIWIFVSCTLIFIIFLFNIYTSQKKLTAKLSQMAFVDELTGCSTFGKFKIDCQELLGSNHNSDMEHYLIKLDINNFKLINELYSFETGNAILKALSDGLSAAINQKTDRFARIHADEFAILLAYKAPEEVEEKKHIFYSHFYSQCAKILESKVMLQEGRYSLIKGHPFNFIESFEKVNFVHKLAKARQLDSIVFDEKAQELAYREHELENRMEYALELGEFHMYLQPKYKLSDEKAIGAEALIRWIVDGVPYAYPNEFIPLCEKNRFIITLDMYMFEQACKLIKSWIDRNIQPMAISVNFSRRHLENKNFVSELIDIVNKYDVPFDFLEIELTETAMFDNIDTMQNVMCNLHDVGFSLSMDDFGTGYSSLGLLKNIVVDTIKMDKCFFDESSDHIRSRIVISKIIQMANELNIKTVAEGVETKENIELLRELGCEIVQGYYYVRPLPIGEFEKKVF